MLIGQRNVNGFFFSLFTLCLSSQTFAGGLFTYEIGTPDLGLASAGYAARAQDAATAMTNPAGMTRLAHTELLLGIQPFYGDVVFSPNAKTTTPGDNGGNAVSWFPGGGAFLVVNVTENLKLGLSSFGNFGSAISYDDNWVGRYYLQKAMCLGITIAPSLAYRFNEMWSMGGAINAMYGILSQTSAVDNDPLGFFDKPDGTLKIKDQKWGYGWTLGVLFEATKNARFGLTYTSEINLNFESSLDLTNVFPNIIPGGSFSTPLELGLTVPQSVMASFYHQWCPTFALLGNAGWQNWENYGKMDVIIGEANPRSVTVNHHYDDTWHVALGMQTRITSLWQFSLGFAYDTSMVSDAERTVSVPVGPQWRGGIGLQYLMCDRFDLGAGYTLMWNGDLPLDQDRGILTGTVAGEYADASVSFMGIYFHWKFM